MLKGARAYLSRALGRTRPTKGRFYSKIFQDRRNPEYWFVDKNGAVRHIEGKNVDALLLNWFEPSEMKDIMAYLNTGKWYCW